MSDAGVSAPEGESGSSFGTKECKEVFGESSGVVVEWVAEISDVECWVDLGGFTRFVAPRISILDVLEVGESTGGVLCVGANSEAGTGGVGGGISGSSTASLWRSGFEF